MSFNKEQKAAINHKDGPLIVVAGPGSGKTTVVVNRTAKLIEKGVNPYNILVITFTKAAAKEMQMRYEALTQCETPGVTFGTIHSVALAILTTSFDYTYENVLTERDEWNVLREIIKNNKIYTEDINTLIKDLVSAISNIKSGMLKPPYDIECGCREEQLQLIFNEYCNYCKQNKKIDYDDMQIECLKLLKKNKDILDCWRDRYQYIQVDECQDVCHTQMELIELLANPRNNLCIVGDDDQSLYQFRGAKPEIMLAFEKKANAKRITLDTNYRSGKKIVSAASEFIKSNSKRFDKDFKSVREKGSIEIKPYRTPELQAIGVIGDIKKLLNKGTSLDNIAIIYRTNKECPKIASVLMDADIPFVAKTEGVVNLFEHWIFKDIVRFHELGKSINTAPFGEIKKALKRPTRYIPNEALQQSKSLDDLVEWGVMHRKPYIARNIFRFKQDIKTMSRMKLQSFLDYLINHMDYKKALLNFADYNRMNPQELIDILDEIVDTSKTFDSFDEWVEYAKDYTFTLKKSIDETKEGIYLMTMHGSKGLEFKHVFIINANEGFTPYSHKGEINDIEEERRMFYVAMTRAKDFLHISYTNRSRGKKMRESRFVTELAAVMDNQITNKALLNEKE